MIPAPAAPQDDILGRERERAEIEASLRASLRGRAHLVLLVGEPGIGKTWLASAAARRAQEIGAQVLWGRCWEGGGAPAFWPWTQIVRDYVRGLAGDELCELLGERPRDLAQLAPEILSSIEACPEPVDPGQVVADGRFRVFGAVASMVRVAAAQRPLVLVIDDIHAADAATLRLLQFVCRDAREARLLVIATHREGEVRVDAGLSELIGELAREGDRIFLRGLSPSEVGQLICRRVEGEPPPGLAEAVHEATEGNPFFVDELVRLLLAEGRLEAFAREPRRQLRVPDQVRESVRRRLRPLPPQTQALLSVASVLGREFDLALLARLATVEGNAAAGGVAECLEAALRAGVLAPSPPLRERYRFAHAFIRQTLYDDVAPGRRLRLHQAAGHALAAAHPLGPGAHTAEVAHHLVLALPAGDAQAAIGALRQAGGFAMRRRAYGEAAAHHRRALQVLSAQAPPDAHQRCELLLELGEALARGCDGNAARSAFLEAAELARTAGTASILARAAVGVADIGLGLPEGEVNRQRLELLQSALAAVGESDGPWRARLLGRLAVELYYGADLEQRRALADEAVAMARRLHDPVTLAHVLGDWHCALRLPSTLAERLAVGEEMLRLAQRAGDDDLLLRAHAWRILDFFECGDAERLDGEVAQLARRAAALRQPRHLWLATHFRAVRAHSRGELEEAERLAFEAARHGEETGDPAAPSLLAQLVFALRSDQGRLEEFEPALRAHFEPHAQQAGVIVGVARAHLALGRRREAQASFEQAAVDDFAAVPDDHARLMVLAWLAEVCAAVGDEARAAILYRLLLPYRKRLALLLHPATFCDRPVAHFLGLLAQQLGQADEAAAHYEESLASASRMGMRGALAQTRYAQARLLLARGQRDAAMALARETTAAAAALGLAGLRRQLEELCSDGEPDEVSGGPAEAVFQREGEFWTVSYGGRTCRVRDAKGFTYLAQLLRHPGRSLHAIELANPEGRGAAGGAGALGDAGEVLDAAARRSYKRRLEELRGEVASAGDAAERQRLEGEREFLERELNRALGLGRERRAASDAERARVNVTRAIGGAVRRIAEQHAELAAHLDRCVRTGTFCAYEPDPKAPPRWRL